MSNTPAQTNPTFKAIVKSGASAIQPKNNGGQYVLHNCEITEGPLKGLVVTGTRTVKNAQGKTKEPVALNTEVMLHLTRVPSTQDPSKMVNFFEISTGMSASQDEINAKLALMLADTVSQAVGQQTF
jgi:hypothetical protein